MQILLGVFFKLLTSDAQSMALHSLLVTEQLLFAFMPGFHLTQLAGHL
jgi:hypothetical protein